MLFDKIYKHDNIIKHLKYTVDNNKIANSQLFVSNEGSGDLSLIIAYAEHILLSKSINKESTSLKVSKLAHPDLHFIFPVANTATVKTKAISSNFFDKWREFNQKHIYGNLSDWLYFLEIENKQAQIGVEDASNLLKTINLKAYEGGYKIVIIWQADKMNIATSNKLLKLIEEPPTDTIFLLTTHNEDLLLDTIKSRCQKIVIPSYSDSNIADYLLEYKNIDIDEAKNISFQSDRNLNKAIKLLDSNENSSEFEDYFVTWVRAAFKAKGNPNVIQNLIKWSDDISKWGREKQKQFLDFCLFIFRQALLKNYEANELVFYKPISDSFKLENFAPFVHGNNIDNIYTSINDSIYHIERNANAKICLLDLSIKLTRLLHTK
ncbi:MAG: DNA polymerase III subunit delta' [Flavobacteriaceae bacterium]|nr:DNA polymerase III subunit delta' [Flavobacteriaceae bacterium]